MDSTAPLRRLLALRDGRTFAWRSATPADAALVWSWWTDRAMVYWARDQRLGRVDTPPFDGGSVRSYLESLLEVTPEARALDPMVGLIDGQPAAYAELWTKGNSPIASNVQLAEIEDEARGMHLIVANRRARLRGLTVEIGVDAIDWQFEGWPSIDHYIADPDIRNQSAVSMCARVGMKRVALVPLPHKTACVMAVDRQTWQEERPSIDALLDRVIARRRPAETR